MNKVKAVIITIAATSLLATSTAFAQTDSTTTSANNKSSLHNSIHINMHNANSPNLFKSALDSLVKAGTITQADEDTVQNALKTSTQQKSELKDGIKSVLDSLVTAGTITQADEDTVQNALKTSTQQKSEFKDGFKSVLDSLVKAGTITQAKEDAIQSAIKNIKHIAK